MPHSKTQKITVPNVLVAAGHDPSGGAGIQADIEAIRACGGHAAVCISCLTEQNTSNVFNKMAVPDDWFNNCLNRLIEDMQFQSIKVGVLASQGQVQAIRKLKQKNPNCPLVLDPVLVASGGGKLSCDQTTHSLIADLMPLADLITPNFSEAQKLTSIINATTSNRAEDDSIESSVATLQNAGASWVLLKGGDNDLDKAVTTDRLFSPDGQVQHFEHKRLPHQYHGSGCTLASACATALGFNSTSIPAAVQTAIEHTQQWLASAYRPGKGQYIPNRQPHSNA